MTYDKNFFRINSPESCHYEVVTYTWENGKLVIRLTQQRVKDVKLKSPYGDKPMQFIRFSGVQYFAGPTEWQGTGLDRDSSEACLRVLQKTGYADETSTVQKIEDEQLTLYTASLPEARVYVVAKTGELMSY